LWIRLQKENPLPNLTLLFCPISSVLFGTDWFFASFFSCVYLLEKACSEWLYRNA
jgi:hypothetical protein